MNQLPAPPPPEVTAVKQQLGIIGNAPALNQAVERALRVAPIDLSVLVTGESGTGKEFFPKIIHRNSPRKHNKYIAVNCGAIPEGTIDSELFGHEKGAFTGAVASRKGYFEEADGGTIFLDEVGELPLTTQARLLRVLENGEFIKVGSSTVQHTNVRIVAATNVDMAAAIAQGRFREDLYYRLSTVSISVPPLRSRGNDIQLLARKFAADFAERYMMPQITFSDEARRDLMLRPWPGNIRQLKNVVEQIALFEAGKEITPQILSHFLPETSSNIAPLSANARQGSYEQEREMLFNLIFTLRREIDRLKARLDDNGAAGEKITETPRHLVKFAEPTPIITHRHTVGPIDVDVADDDDTVNLDQEQVIEVTPAPANAPDRSGITALTLDQIERSAISDALTRAGGNRKEAAAELNISQRTLYRKIKEYGLE